MMRAFLQQWSSLLAALLVVISIVYTGSILRTYTGGVNDRLSTLEKNIESIRNAIAGNQDIISRLESLSLRLDEKLQNLLVQQDKYIESNEQDVLNTQNSFQALKNYADAILDFTQRIGYVEEILLDMQGRMEDIKKQQNRGNQ